MKALALLSGGLDSIIAVKLIQELGIEVEALHFANPFHQSPKEALRKVQLLANDLKVKLYIREFGEDFLRVIENPRYNYGKNMNPCIDCRIYQLKEAKKLMAEIGASFLITGEVLDKRPHSNEETPWILSNAIRDCVDLSCGRYALNTFVLRSPRKKAGLTENGCLILKAGVGTDRWNWPGSMVYRITPVRQGDAF